MKRRRVMLTVRQIRLLNYLRYRIHQLKTCGFSPRGIDVDDETYEAIHQEIQAESRVPIAAPRHNFLMLDGVPVIRIRPIKRFKESQCNCGQRSEH